VVEAVVVKVVEKVKTGSPVRRVARIR
jgi:hypothetical protein